MVTIATKLKNSRRKNWETDGKQITNLTKDEVMVKLDLKIPVIKAYQYFTQYFARATQNQRQEIILLFKKLFYCDL